MEKRLSDISEQDLMKEFMSIVTESITIRPNEITVKTLDEYMNLAKPNAEYILRKLELQNLLKVRKILIDGHVVNAYSPCSGTWQDVIGAIKQEE